MIIFKLLLVVKFGLESIQLGRDGMKVFLYGRRRSKDENTKVREL